MENKKRVIIVGGGIVGSNIAYELSNYPELDVVLIDEKKPASGATGAALGLLMGVISRKTKGRAWRLRNSSLQRYQSLILELEELTGLSIPHNPNGMVKLLYSTEEISKYQQLATIRQRQGYELNIWDTAQLKNHCPEVNTSTVKGAVYSPKDMQINPSLLTQALVEGARLKGATCIWGKQITSITAVETSEHIDQSFQEIHLNNQTLTADYLVLATGLGTSPLLKDLNYYLKIKPVLGQALLIKHDRHWQHNHDFNPVITANDIHLVPQGKDTLWLGATVEFSDETDNCIANEQLLNNLYQQAISFCPSLSNASVVKSWFGERPRPEGKPAPIIERLPHYRNIILATGHYRNGVLLAPATAKLVTEMILE